MSSLQTEVEKGTDKLFGHHRHDEVDRGKLVSVQGAYRTELLRPAAAAAFHAMRRDARRDARSIRAMGLSGGTCSRLLRRLGRRTRSRTRASARPRA